MFPFLVLGLEESHSSDDRQHPKDQHYDHPYGDGLVGVGPEPRPLGLYMGYGEYSNNK